MCWTRMSSAETPTQYTRLKRDARSKTSNTRRHGSLPLDEFGALTALRQCSRWRVCYGFFDHLRRLSSVTSISAGFHGRVCYRHSR